MTRTSFGPGPSGAALVVFLVLAGPAALAEDEPQAANSWTFESPVAWYFESDVGFLHAYADDTLHTIDLVEGGLEPHPGIRLPGAERPGSVAHLPATEVLLAYRARRGLLHETEEAGGETSSYGIDLVSGAILWEGAELAVPADTLIDVARGLAILRHGQGRNGELVALEYRSGRVAWRAPAPVSAVWLLGSYVVAAGERATILDIATGETVADEAIDAGKRAVIAATLEGDRFVALDGETVTGYDLGEFLSEEEAAPGPQPAAHVRRSWSVATTARPKRTCLATGVCGIKTYPGRVALLRGLKGVEAIDVVTGRLLWRRDAGKKAPYQAMANFLSPGATHAVEFEKRGLHVDDMGSPEAQGSAKRSPKGEPARKWSAPPSAVWMGEEEFLVFEGPDRVSLFAAHRGEPLWSTPLPERAKYRMTSREKGSMAGRIFAALLLTAVSAANPVAFGSASGYSYNYHYVFLPNLNVRRNLRLHSGGTARDEAREAELPEAAREALRRHRIIERRTFEEAARNIFLVKGPIDDYNVLWLDPEDGNLVEAASYRGDRVHGIEPFPIHRVALVLEENRTRLRLLPLAPADYQR